MRSTKTALLLAFLAAALLAPPAAQAVPRAFFGIAPQTPLSTTDAEYMRAGRIGSVRWPLPWEAVQPSPGREYVWTGFDQVVATAARRRLRVLPVLGGTPRWLAPRPTTLPVDSRRKRRGWVAFVRATVERYGPHGEFWREHRRGSGDFVPKLPVREWQIWNEANFFYFAWPASPVRYARLLKISNRAIKRVEQRARVILSGLFAEPSAKRPNAMHAVDFLERLYRVPGIARSFDGVALHPYAEDARTLRRITEELRQVMIDNRDRRARLYVTEVGWGSQNNPNLVSFEQGVRFQIREMRRAYRYLIDNRRRLNLDAVYWFTWKDVEGGCNFCDSTGFFRRGNRLKPKRAWHAFVRISGGRARP